MILGSGALPEIWVQNESSEDGGGRAGNSKGDTKIIKIKQSSIIKDANTNSSGATVTVNSRAPEAPNIGSGEGRSYTYAYISCKNVSDSKYMTCAMLPQNQHVLFFHCRGWWQSWSKIHHDKCKYK